MLLLNPKLWDCCVFSWVIRYHRERLRFYFVCFSKSNLKNFWLAALKTSEIFLEPEVKYVHFSGWIPCGVLWNDYKEEDTCPSLSSFLFQKMNPILEICDNGSSRNSFCYKQCNRWNKASLYITRKNSAHVFYHSCCLSLSGWVKDQLLFPLFGVQCKECFRNTSLIAYIEYSRTQFLLSPTLLLESQGWKVIWWQGLARGVHEWRWGCCQNPSPV